LQVIAGAKRLYADLQNSGVRCWFAPPDLPVSAKTWDAIDAAIRIRDKLLLILSKSAIANDWVEDEVSKAFAEERRRGGETVLFPVRIDESVMKTAEPWAESCAISAHIGDFRRWKDHDAYQPALDRVLRDLKAALPPRASHNAASAPRGRRRASRPGCSARLVALEQQQNPVALAGRRCYILISLPEHPPLPPISDRGLLSLPASSPSAAVDPAATGRAG
jgi:TIR domain